MKRLAFVLMVSSCATPSSSGEPKRAPGGALVSAGPRCDASGCLCRGEGADPGEGAIPAGQKRFELRTGRGTDPLEVTVEGRGTLTKQTSNARNACGYIDLPPGRHRVRLHARAAEPMAGMAPALFISEYGATTKSWYDTFRFECGASEPCTKDEVRDWLSSVKQKPKGLFDPCGSVRIEGLTWQSDRSPGARLEDLDVELVLHVYAFDPRRAHGDPACVASAAAKDTSSE